VLAVLALAALLTGCSGSAAGPAGTTPVVAVGGAGPKVVERHRAPVEAAPRSARPPNLTWETSVTEARRRAAAERQALLVYVCADWSANTLQIDREVWPAERVRRRLAPLVLVRLDVTEPSAANDDQLDELMVHAVPTVLLFQADGSEVGRLEGGFAAVDVERLVADAL